MAAYGAANRGPLAGAVALLVLLALIPARWSGWTSSLAGMVKLAEAPVSGPTWTLSQWFMRERGVQDNALVKQLENDRDHFKWMWLQEQRETDRLKRLVEQLQKGAALYNELGVAPLVRPVVGSSSDGRGGMLEVRAGSSEGVGINDVVTTEGVQLVGKIVGVHAKTSTVRALTEGGAGAITGVVMTDDDKPGSLCSLSPYKGTLLQGLVAYNPKDPRPQPVVGQTVRLEDSQWPKHSQRLVIGTVTDIKTVTSGRQVIEVKPTVDLDRLSEVVVRLSRPDDAHSVLPSGKPSTDGRQ